MNQSTLRSTQAAVILIIAAILLRAVLFFLADIELHYDEAQYWEWSQKLDWGYYSKGPLVAWLIALSEFIFGHGVWQTRLPAWLASGLFMWLVYRCSLCVWQDTQAAFWAVILVLFSPIYFLLGGVMTTDIILFVFYTWGIWAIYRALVLQLPRGWLEFGVAVGLGCLTKLSMLLLPFAVFVVMVLQRRYWAQFFSPFLWWGALISLLIVSPMIYWNVQHDWVLVRHELGHVQSVREHSLSVFYFLGEQLLAFLPLVTLSILWLFNKKNKQANTLDTSKKVFLLGLAAVCFAFFLFKSMSGKVQINWPAPVYISALIVLSGVVSQLPVLSKRIFMAVLLLMGVLMGVALFPEAVGLKYKKAAFKEMRLWSDPIMALYKNTNNVDFIITDSYKLAGELAFYWPKSIPVYIAGHSGRRHNQHDIWPGLENEKGRNGLYVDKINQPPAVLKKAFDSCTPIAPIKALASDNSLLRTLYVYHCQHYNDTKWPEPVGY